METSFRRAMETGTPRPPVWLMRQAGRYLAEYRATRAEAGGFIDLCMNPALAAEVSMQPIRRFGFDAAIIFSDILMIPHGLGQKLWFETGEGPRLEPVATVDAFAALRTGRKAMIDRLNPVYEAIRQVRAALAADKSLIGFVGAPWTVATYVIAGRGKDQQKGALTLLDEAPDLFESIINLLIDCSIEHLLGQIKAGCDTVKIFDSWAGALAHDDALFTRWSLRPMMDIAKAVKAVSPDTRVIVFPRGAGAKYAHFAEIDCIDCLAIDNSMPDRWFAEMVQSRKAIQGNLPPEFMEGDIAPMLDRVDAILDAFGGNRFIFNLSHGITPQGRIENVQALIEHLHRRA